MRCVSEQGAIPLDLLARALGVKLRSVRSQANRLQRQGWLVVDSFSIDKYVWLRATGAVAFRLGFSRPQCTPEASTLAHRRGIIEAYLQLREEFARAVWLTEGDILRRDGRPKHLPDAELQVGGKRWAIEVELSRKSLPLLRERSADLLKGYDKLLYFCADPVRPLIETLQAELSANRLEIRPAVTVRWFAAPSPRRGACLAPYRPSEAERALLALIAQEGAVAVDQLSALSGIEPSALEQELAQMERASLVQQGFGAAGYPAWVWCTYRGARASGTGLGRMVLTGPATLAHRRALMAVRLELVASRPRGRWLTKRVLAQGRARGIAVEMAVFEYRKRRVAVMALLDRPSAAGTAKTIRRLAAEHDAVWLYCSSATRSWAECQLGARGWENVSLRDLPS